MNNKIKEILIKSGWFADRSVDISSCINSFKKEEICLTETSISFMKEFYGLKIKLIAEFPKLKGEIITIDINSHLCIFPELLLAYNNYYNKTLIPIADCMDYAMVILIDENGKFYGASDQFIAIIGNNFEEVLSNMINGVINTEEFLWNTVNL